MAPVYAAKGVDAIVLNYASDPPGDVKNIPQVVPSGERGLF